MGRGQGAQCPPQRAGLGAPASPPVRRCQWPSDTAPAAQHNRPPSADTCWLSCVGRGREVRAPGAGAWGGGQGWAGQGPDTCWTPRLCSSLQTARSGRWPGETQDGGGHGGAQAASVTRRSGPAWDTAEAIYACSAMPIPLSWCSDTRGHDRRKNHGPTGLAAAAWQGPTATHLLDVHQLRLVDLGDRNVVFRRNGESALGGT